MTNTTLTYDEPGTTQVLKLTLFFLSLNLVNYFFDWWLYCGLIGQVLLGTALGTPGANFFSTDFEKAVLQLGYLGLILIVYEGKIYAVGILFLC